MAGHTNKGARQMIIRQPAVANQFYPGDPLALRREIAQYIPTTVHAQPAKGVVSPHAGYVYSGHVAGAVYSKVIVPEHVVILGPNHTGYGTYAEIMTEGIWQMPFGDVPIAEDLAITIMENCPQLTDGYQAHLYEHSLEVQVPFLQYLQPNLKIVPICLGPLELNVCLAIGQGIARAIAGFGEPVLLVASTDMSHYVPVDVAKKLDGLAIREILKLDPVGLYNIVKQYGISMCGYVPTTITLEACKDLGAQNAELVKYATSGDVSGDYSRVVGYAGFVIR